MFWLLCDVGIFLFLWVPWSRLCMNILPCLIFVCFVVLDSSFSQACPSLKSERSGWSWEERKYWGQNLGGVGGGLLLICSVWEKKFILKERKEKKNWNGFCHAIRISQHSVCFYLFMLNIKYWLWGTYTCFSILWSVRHYCVGAEYQSQLWIDSRGRSVFEWQMMNSESGIDANWQLRVLL